VKAKLVRDFIPTIIREAGKIPIVHNAKTDMEAKAVTIAKMYEEVQEFELDPSLEEAADMLEVLITFCSIYSLKLEDVIETAKNKTKERGGFKRGIILQKVGKQQ